MRDYCHEACTADDIPVGQVLDSHEQLERELAEAREQRDRLAAAFGELIAAVRVNSMRDTFREATHDQIETWLKPWIEKLAAVKE